PLAPAAAATLPLVVIAAALGFAFYGPADQRTQLLGYLREKQLLLVLDNAEHLLDGPSAGAREAAGPGIELLAEIVEQGAEVKLLVTSREGLRLQSEWAVELEGLPAPDDAPARRIECFGAATLFVQRAPSAARVRSRNA